MDLVAVSHGEQHRRVGASASATTTSAPPARMASANRALDASGACSVTAPVRRSSPATSANSARSGSPVAQVQPQGALRALTGLVLTAIIIS